MGLFSKIFGTYSEKQVKKLIPTVDLIESMADRFGAMSDDELRAYTDVLKDRLNEGQTLDDILPEAFALVREADERVLGKRPFRVQLIGGILLHQGRIAEMKTGEGKTLVATLPAYLNALSGKGVHIVTVNNYLAKRDSEEMGRVYEFLGLSTGLIIHGQTPEEKRAAYAADITYGTNSELGFDYLRDNMVVYKEEMVQRGHSFAILDEVDSILIDEARTPLIISGRGTESTELYEKADQLARTMSKLVIKEIDAKQDLDLNCSQDYVVDEKGRNAVLTKNGIEKAERFFGLENLSDPDNTTIYHHVNTAIRAHGVMKRDIDYIVKDNNVLIIDHFTGRIMPGRRYNNGLHQAIEAKEHVEVQRENVTVATVTYQNFFRMYGKLSGMTGTALTEDEEFRQIYKLDVVEVPTNKPMIRIDHNDSVYATRSAKIAAIVKQIRRCNAKGQPVLVGTVSIEKSEELSKVLNGLGIKHTVLNAKHHEMEAEIVARAGKLGAVTISTNMAGRGTDIMLGGNPEHMAKTELKRRGYSEEAVAEANGSANTDNDEILAARSEFRELYSKFKQEIAPEAERVRAAGGLFILGTERHDSRRIDNQLRGRSGRQGDPGESRFYISFEDDLLRLFGGGRLTEFARRGMGDDGVINMKIASGAIETAQKRIEDANFQRRKNVLTYDDVMNRQRNVIYKERMNVLLEDNIQSRIEGMIEETVGAAFDMYLDQDEMDIDGFTRHFRGVIKCTDAEGRSKDQWRLDLINAALDIYHGKDELFRELPGAPEGIMREVEKKLLLRNVDKKWMEHLETMDDLKSFVGLNSYAQRDPVAMYKLQGAELFDRLIDDIKEDTVREVLSVSPRVGAVTRERVVRTVSEGFTTPQKRKPAQRPMRSEKVGNNDPCPCGSGKKYKKCCMHKDASARG